MFCKFKVCKVHFVNNMAYIKNVVCNISHGFLILLLITKYFATIHGQKLSKEKCEEYGKAVYVKKMNAVMSVRSAAFSEESDCGIVSVPLIIGGKKANEKEFPHTALIGFGNGDDINWDCGGTLISEIFVLTAAHCMVSQQYGECSMVKLGIIDKTEVEDAQIFEIVKRIPHPEYRRPAKYNDIALVELDRPAEFNGYVRPACLATDGALPKTALASGFGKTAYSDRAASDQLMKVSLSIIENEKCGGFFVSERKRTMHRGVAGSMLCAGELKGGKDTCQGDSGGPLQTVLTEPYCMYSIVGVTSFGKFCGFANSPAVYTRVSYYVPWIENVIWLTDER